MSSSSEEYDLDLIKKCTDHALFKDSLYTVGLPENEGIFFCLIFYKFHIIII